MDRKPFLWTASRFRRGVVMPRFDFDTAFEALAGYPPFPWQRRLFGLLASGCLPSAVDIPTGLGKTDVMALWLLALAGGTLLPRRLVYVVDRRAVVDQATAFAVRIRDTLCCRDDLDPVRRALGLDGRPLPISTLRGRYRDNREWLEDPAAPAIVVGTVDMVGSRLLFSGYGVSRRMWPYEAGLMGCDTLVVLDEAHLARPFHRLLQTIEKKRSVFSGPAASPGLPPLFRMLPLSATLCGEEESFRLNDEDRENGIVRKRLNAVKALSIENLESGGKQDDALAGAFAERAWRLAQEETAVGDRPPRIVIYCDRRSVAEKVETSLKKRIKEEEPEAKAILFVGGRRVHEREEAAGDLKTHGLIADSAAAPSAPVFLVATSAGEVGVDLDADHMVCDLVAWERMVQRLGRVNRRGAGAAQVLVIDQGPPEEKASSKDGIARHKAVRKLLEALPRAETGDRDASPAALSRLREEVSAGEIEMASTPMPLYPALSRPLVDAWAMTSLAEHTGRPEVTPWLRGWVDDEPQMTIAWRHCLPLCFESDGSHDPIEIPKSEIEAFFENAPLQTEELLETKTWRVVDWLRKRARKLLRTLHKRAEAAPSTDGATGFDLLQPIRQDIPVAFLLDHGGKQEAKLDLNSVHDLPVKELNRRLAGRRMVVDARLGGVENGLLADGRDEPVPTIEDNWGKVRGENPSAIRVRPVRGDESTEPEALWNKTFEMPYLVSPEGEPQIRLIVEKRYDAEDNEEIRSMAPKAQPLNEHQAWVADEAMRIAEEIGLSEGDQTMLAAVARHHDDGKAAPRWQRAFNADRNGGPYAKTTGPFNRHVLNGYRHEFGSMLDAQRRGLDGIERGTPRFELALHLIAAHHGNARPAIEIGGCDSLPPSAAAGEAREIAMRFARLQRQWGPWGLAWWEALLRAADQQASRRLKEEAARKPMGKREQATSESVAQRDLFTASAEGTH